MSVENAVVIVNKTRLECLIERFNTRSQARFYIEHSGGDFSDYETEHFVFKEALRKVVEKFSVKYKVKVITRDYLPNYLFTQKDLPVVLGQDGLVANTAKYVDGLPVLAINPDESRYDGVLLPFSINSFTRVLPYIDSQEFDCSEITMAKATLNNGQSLLAFNDLFIGPASHTSARYQLRFDEKKENQSSSGIIVSTGAGSTGWLSSIVNMVNGITSEENKCSLSWDDDKLVFVVREPFRSKYSSADVVFGNITRSRCLELESFMPQNGVIFSDGIEADHLDFNSGAVVKIGIAEKKARIINS